MSKEKPSRLKTFFCGFNVVGAAAEAIVGSAKECWCCSFWRGVLVGVTLSGVGYTALLSFII